MPKNCDVLRCAGVCESVRAKVLSSTNFRACNHKQALRTPHRLSCAVSNKHDSRLPDHGKQVPSEVDVVTAVPGPHTSSCKMCEGAPLDLYMVRPRDANSSIVGDSL